MELPLKFEMAARLAREVVESTIKINFPPHSLLNVNIPNHERKDIRGQKITRQGFRYYSTGVSKRVDPRGRDYYWIGCPYLGFEKGEETDCHAVNEGWVAITPITIDCTQCGLRPQPTGVRNQESGFKEAKHFKCVSFLDLNSGAWCLIPLR